MLNQLFTAADIAADHRRELLADAATHRLARAAVAPAPTASRWARLLRSAARLAPRPARSAAEAR
ncbi:hypothetical protein [Pseudonocardia nigra]|uniref:hypothetical protein n=1 Tax=Pseudonocardia nigra TaxID=1921578 RepID=UPI001C5F8DCE|nr:hypothetical protein [Pseudonocardia nigra]